MIRLITPLTQADITGLKAGDEVLLSGVIFTARDAAHKRLHDLIKTGKKLPLDLKGAVIYYAGPTPARPGMAIGACGPTTSSRMDNFTPDLIKKGLRVMIGKGDRSVAVKSTIKKYGCVYFIATGGLGALLAARVKNAKKIFYKDLGAEAIHRLVVEDFPVIVAIDSKGRNIYDAVRRKKK
ncbi:MAG TPA: Fe-S-containing hydro-lyase [Candidatus Omnitrophota bacterium]|nr:Fe-S-containing hydro-lyase [Candidatus Omnitrophota bacterium]